MLETVSVVLTDDVVVVVVVVVELELELLLLDATAHEAQVE